MVSFNFVEQGGKFVPAFGAMNTELAFYKEILCSFNSLQRQKQNFKRYVTTTMVRKRMESTQSGSWNIRTAMKDGAKPILFVLKFFDLNHELLSMTRELIIFSSWNGKKSKKIYKNTSLRSIRLRVMVCFDRCVSCQ